MNVVAKKELICEDKAGTKKAALLYILDILQARGNNATGIDVTEIIEELNFKYGVKLNRETVSNNLDILLDFFPDNITYRLNNAQKRCGWRWVETRATDFDASEIRLLLGVVECYGKLDVAHKQDLMNRIAKLGEGVVADTIPPNLGKPSKRNDTYRLFYNIGIIGEAIAKKKLITFSKGFYKADGVIAKADGDEARVHIVSPKAIAFKNNTYMMIATFGDDEYPYVMHSCIDTMFDLEIVTERTSDDMPAMDNQLRNMQKYLDEHLYMYSAEPERILVRIYNNSTCIRQMYEQFGLAVMATRPCEDDQYIDFIVREPIRPMVFWALQYSDMAEILEPESLRTQVVEQVRELERKYGCN